MDLKNESKELTTTQEQELENWKKKLKTKEALVEAKNLVSNMARVGCDPEYNLQQIAEKIIPKICIKREASDDKDLEMINKVVLDLGFENDLSIMEAVEKQYRGMMINLRRDMIREFDCKTYSEKALVDMAINAYSRNLSLSKMLVNTATTGHTTPGLNLFMSVMGKEVDRANRHFITALEVLRQFKQPELKVNVRTNNAFISQNQQFNNNQNKQDEAIEVK